MNSRQQQLYAALGAACLLAGCAPEAEDRGGTGTTALATAGTTPAKHCVVWLTVINSDDEHLPDTQRVRFTGPTIDGDYRIRPMTIPPLPKHWLIKDYDATLSGDETGNVFTAEVEVQDDKHAEVSVHDYEITIEFADGCPDKALFHTERHADGNTDHGGDAEMD